MEEKMEIKQLWDKTPGMCEEIPTITEYLPEGKKSDMAIVIFPGGGYEIRAEHEGKDYAEFLSENGYTAFVVDYRVAPHKFPLPLLDARRAVRFVRYYAEKYGIDKNKIAVMGSSAGGHLAALCSTYYEPIDFENADEIDNENFIPNYQILCYPVISLFGKGITHFGSGKNLLGELLPERAEDISPHLIVSSKTPPAFIWHTFADESVNVKNSLMYANNLKNAKVNAEIHIFPDGHHGLGLALGEDKISKHVFEWSELLLDWLKYIDINKAQKLVKGYNEQKEYRITPVVDRVYGGDSFAGGVICGFVDGKDFKQALEYGVAASSLKHKIPGDFNLVTRFPHQFNVTEDKNCGVGKLKKYQVMSFISQCAVQ